MEWMRNTGEQVVHVINSCHLDIGFADSSQGKSHL